MPSKEKRKKVSKKDTPIDNAVRRKPTRQIKNSEGVVVEVLDPEKAYEPGLVTPDDYRDTQLPFYRFTMREFQVLEEFAKDLDLVRACAAAGYMNPSAKAAKIMSEERFRAEIEEVFAVYRANVKMTAERASHRFMEALDTFQRDYSGMEDGDKTKMAASISKMLDSMMKATGHYDKGGVDIGDQIVINIDLGGEGEVEVDSRGRKARVSSGGGKSEQ